ncbi:MAG: hypothetical protein NC429_07830 [Lachnospiraceae bacterium]|nr:hypothetical protein [Lachnospiraceae bacterium]
MDQTEITLLIFLILSFILAWIPAIKLRPVYERRLKRSRLKFLLSLNRLMDKLMFLVHALCWGILLLLMAGVYLLVR